MNSLVGKRACKEKRSCFYEESNAGFSLRIFCFPSHQRARTTAKVCLEDPVN